MELGQYYHIKILDRHRIVALGYLPPVSCAGVVPCRWRIGSHFVQCSPRPDRVKSNRSGSLMSSLENKRYLPASSSSLARRDNALACLNELVTDALALVPDCLAYMRQIKHPEVFRFCAIPQVRVLSRYRRLNKPHQSSPRVWVVIGGERKTCTGACCKRQKSP